MEREKKLLVVVDMQNDFIGGALGTQEAQSILPAVRARIADARKEGGALRVFTGRLRRVDETAGLLIFEDGQRLPLAAVRALESEVFPEFL